MTFTHLPYPNLWPLLVLLWIVLLTINQFWTPITKALSWLAMRIAYCFFALYFWLKAMVKRIATFFQDIRYMITVIRTESETEYDIWDPRIKL